MPVTRRSCTQTRGDMNPNRFPIRDRLRWIHILTTQLTQCGSNPPVTSYESASQRIMCLSFRPAGSGVESGAPRGPRGPGSVLQHARAENYLLLRFQARAKKNIQLQLEAECETERARDPVSPAVSTQHQSSFTLTSNPT